MRTLVLAAASALAGALVVVSCSDDAPPPADADAGTCDCPAAERPIDASRLHRVESGRTNVPFGATRLVGVNCPTGELLLGGSCYLDLDETQQQVFLKEAGMGPLEPSSTGVGWNCLYGNQSLVGTAMVRAQALCLRP